MKRDKRVEEIRHEGRAEWFVYLKPGYRLEDAHCFGADNPTQIKETMKRVRICECSECKHVWEGS